MRPSSFVLALALLSAITFPLAASGTDLDRLALDPAAEGLAGEILPLTLVPGESRALVSVPSLTLSEHSIAGERFALLGIDGGQLTAQLGAPRLPVMRVRVAIPRGARIEAFLEGAEPREWALAGLGLPERLAPVQPPRPKTPDAEDAPLALDATIYERDAFWPNTLVSLVDRAVIRGQEFALIEIRPVQVNPARGLIRAWSEGTLTVRAEGGDPCASTRAAFLGASLDEGLLGGTLPAPPACGIEAQGSRGPGVGSAGGAEGMMIVVADAFADAVIPFAEWKRRTGFRVDVVKLSDLGTSPSDTDIKAAIQDAYDTWTAPDLGYVLMVGDTDFTPIHNGDGGSGSQVTDNWYVCLDGSDYLPDAAIARISTRSVSETEDVIAKLLVYEQATFSSASWTKRAGFIGTSDSGHIGLIEGTHDDCIDEHYTPSGFEATSWSHGYASCDRHYNSYDADTSEISDSIDEGRTVVNYSGHGSTTSWQGPTSHGGYGQSDVRANTNDQMHPFVISNACITGSLAVTECFGETWQKQPHAGSIAFLGASNNSYWDEDDLYQRSLHDYIFSEGKRPTISEINNRAKRDLYDHYGNTGTVHYYYDMYNMLSEPSLLLWLQAPREIVVNYDEELPTGSTEFVVSVTRSGSPVEGELVAVRKLDEGVFSAGYTDASGSVTLPLEPPPSTPGTLEVTVTGADDRPHLGSSEVIPIDGPWVRYVSHVVDDTLSGCDSDGVADVGETASFRVSVENIGSEGAEGLFASLASASDVLVLNSPVALGTLAEGSATEAVFDVRVGAGVSCLEDALFDLTLECSGCDPRSDSFVERLDYDERVDTTEESMEHGGAEPSGWSHEAMTGSDDWALVTDHNHTPGGSYSYFTSERAAQKEVALVSEVLYPEGEATLTFWQRYELTDPRAGAFIELSTNSGQTWLNAAPYIVTHGYTHRLNVGTEMREAWSGSSEGWVLTELDVSAFSGSPLQLRFHFGAVNGTAEGWWVDDLRLESAFTGCDVFGCAIPGSLTITSVTREGDESLIAWKDDPVAAEFRVWRSNDPSSMDHFDDVSDEDPDTTDTLFRDASAGAFSCWLVQGVGPDGEGPLDR